MCRLRQWRPVIGAHADPDPAATPRRLVALLAAAVVPAPGAGQAAGPESRADLLGAGISQALARHRAATIARRPVRAGARRHRARQRLGPGDDPLPPGRLGRRDPRLPRPTAHPGARERPSAARRRGPERAHSRSRPVCSVRARTCSSSHFVADIAPSGASIIRFHDPTDGSRLPLHAARPRRREPALSLLRPARPQGARARSRSPRPPAGPSSPTAPAALGRHDGDAGHDPVRARPSRSAPISSPSPPGRGRQASSTDDGRTITAYVRRSRAAEADARHAARAQPPRARLDGALVRPAVSVREVRLRARAGVPVRRHGASRAPSSTTRIGFIFRERPTLPRRLGRVLDDPARGRPPVVRRPRHDALVRRSLAQGGVRHLHGRQGAGRPRARAPTRGRRSTSATSRRRTPWIRPPARARSGRRSAISTRPRATTARSSTTRRRRAQAARLSGGRLGVPGRRPPLPRPARLRATRPGGICSAPSAPRRDRPLDGFGREFMLRAGMPVVEQRVAVRDGRIARLALRSGQPVHRVRAAG